MLSIFSTNYRGGSVKKFFMAMLLLLALLLTSSVSAQDMQQDEMMKAWQEYMTPGAEHKMLANLEGEWEGDITMWMDPIQPPQNYKGLAKYKAIMGGRYMEGHYSGEMMGMPFEGRDINGFDKAKKKYFTFWIDNMGTGTMFLEGTYDKESNSLNYEGEMLDPMGNNMKVREVIKIIDKDHQIFEMYMDDGRGEMKSMEIKYTRK